MYTVQLEPVDTFKTPSRQISHRRTLAASLFLHNILSQSHSALNPKKTKLYKGLFLKHTVHLYVFMVNVGYRRMKIESVLF